MLRTMDLQYIYEELQEDVFDFDYEWTDLVIGTKSYTKQFIQDAFKEYWWYYQIGYSTLDEFKWRLKRNWKSMISALSQKLNLYPQNLSLKDRILEKQYENTTDNKYSDTPNEPMLAVDVEGKYLTDRTYVNLDGNSTETETRNELDKYYELDRKVQDVMYVWIKEFKYLFLTDIIIYDGFWKGGCC